MRLLKKHKNILIESALWAVAATALCYLVFIFGENVSDWI